MVNKYEQDDIKILNELVEKLSENALLLIRHANKILINTVDNQMKTMPVSPVLDMSSYEEQVRNILINAGGTAFQSDIVKTSLLSKAKISAVLSGLRKNGEIIKIKNGKENIIKLVNTSCTSEIIPMAVSKAKGE